MQRAEPHIEQHIYTVSQLTHEVKALLEERFPMIWVTGEVSNFNVPASGHFYFSLKNAEAQIRAVMFRGQTRHLRFLPEDGLAVTGLGRLSVYEPRGTYQIIFEYLEPKGVGALQVQFEQLKRRLAAEGLFDAIHKQPLPFMPRKISIITSPTGAVVHDILDVVHRRFPNVHLEVIPAQVQGEAAASTITAALELLNQVGDADVAILARGGGSLEDLSPFNSEAVARAIFASRIPIISAVGHETDFTIADFVADLRAPTPSAAAELVVPVWRDVARRCIELKTTLEAALTRYVERQRLSLRLFSDRLVRPHKRIEDLRLRIDDLTMRLLRTARQYIYQQRQHLGWRMQRLAAHSPRSSVAHLQHKLDGLKKQLLGATTAATQIRRAELRTRMGQLHALNPEAILARGYSITRMLPTRMLVRDANQVTVGQNVEVKVHKGALRCRVEEKQQP